MSFKKFNPVYTPLTGKWSGVCAGFAYYIGVKTWIVRFWFIALTISLFPLPIIIYFILAMCLPTWYAIPEDYEQRCE